MRFNPEREIMEDYYHFSQLKAISSVEMMSRHSTSNERFSRLSADGFNDLSSVSSPSTILDTEPKMKFNEAHSIFYS